MSDRKYNGRRVNGKGYYIALILCAAAIGITGYLYYRNANQEDTTLNNGQDVVDVVGTQPQDVEAVATQPQADSDQNPTTQPTQSPIKKPLQTGFPVEGETVASYAMDCLSYNSTTRDWRVHNGVDIAAETGTAVCAAAAGTVYTVYEDDAMGMTVVIQHDDGYMTKYSSLDSEVSVTPGQEVTLGQAIGCVGATAMLETALGEHVHFSVTCYDESIDPMEFLNMD